MLKSTNMACYNVFITSLRLAGFEFKQLNAMPKAVIPRCVGFFL